MDAEEYLEVLSKNQATAPVGSSARWDSDKNWPVSCIHIKCIGWCVWQTETDPTLPGAHKCQIWGHTTCALMGSISGGYWTENLATEKVITYVVLPWVTY